MKEAECRTTLTRRSGHGVPPSLAGRAKPSARVNPASLGRDERSEGIGFLHPMQLRKCTFFILHLSSGGRKKKFPTLPTPSGRKADKEMMKFEIRKMKPGEMNFAVELAAEEGWNPGLFDAPVFYATDPGGFLIGTVDGQPAGCVSAVSYGPDFGFIGFFVMRPEYRKKGYGIQLGLAAMARLNSKTIGIDGVFEQQENYRRAGFRFAYRNLRYEYRTGRRFFGAEAPVTAADRLPQEKILDYDRQCFPAPRKIFLEKWLTMPESTALAWFENGRVRGYGVIRKCRTGYKIGPLFADHGAVASALFSRLSETAPENSSVYLDIPESQTEALRMAESLGMTKIFGTARMYRGPDPDIRTEKVFGVTSFELG
jgi:GNAT superfamily N-acetyltransferase